MFSVNARMAECTHITPEEIVRRERYLRARDRPVQIYDPFTWPYPHKAAGFTVLASFVTISIHNLWHRMSWHYALYPRLLSVGALATLGYGMGKLRAHHYATRDAVVDHYMELHPEDFERARDYYGRPYSEVFMPWRPVRTHYFDFSKDDEERELKMKGTQ